jgi:hypothetical protein
MLTWIVEVNDAMFCEHGLEVCKTCEFDGREGELHPSHLGLRLDRMGSIYA